MGLNVILDTFYVPDNIPLSLAFQSDNYLLILIQQELAWQIHQSILSNPWISHRSITNIKVLLNLNDQYIYFEINHDRYCSKLCLEFFQIGTDLHKKGKISLLNVSFSNLEIKEPHCKNTKQTLPISCFDSTNLASSAKS